MGTYYRLNELGFRLPAGVQILTPEAAGTADAATAIVDAAERRAAEIVAEAEAAYRAKCEEGYAAGQEQAKRENLERVLGESLELDRALRGMEADVVRLVGLCVRKLMAEFDDTARAESVVRGALRQMRREKRAELRVSPIQFSHFKGAIASLISDFPEIELVDVVEDATLTPPKIILESRVGRVEADVTGQLKALDTMLDDIAARFGETNP